MEEIDKHRFMVKLIMATANYITCNDNASLLNAAHFHHDLIAYEVYSSHEFVEVTSRVFLTVLAGCSLVDLISQRYYIHLLE